MLRPVSPPNVLLVEGNDDQHVVIHICQRSQQMPIFDIFQRGSVNSLLDSIRMEVRAPGLATLGILVDANDNLSGRWRAVAGRLRAVDIGAPDTPGPNGTIVEGFPRVGVWLMPDNKSTGELEDFVEQMIPPNDPVWPLSQAYIDGIPVADRKFTDGKTLRAKVHAWLATREAPRPIGLAIGAGDLDVNSTASLAFVNWLRDLFG